MSDNALAEAERKSLQLCNLAGTMMLACKQLRSLQRNHAELGAPLNCACRAPCAMCRIALPDLSDEAIDRLIAESNAQAAALSAAKEWDEARRAYEAALRDPSLPALGPYHARVTDSEATLRAAVGAMKGESDG